MGAACLMLILVAYHAVTQWLSSNLEVHSFAAIMAGSFGIAAGNIASGLHRTHGGVGAPVPWVLLPAPGVLCMSTCSVQPSAVRHPFKFPTCGQRLCSAAEAVVDQQEAIADSDRHRPWHDLQAAMFSMEMPVTRGGSRPAIPLLCRYVCNSPFWQFGWDTRFRYATSMAENNPA